MEHGRDQKNATDRVASARRADQGLKPNNAGFSFIDVMLALVVLTFGVLAMADLHILSKRNNTTAQTLTAAEGVAEAKMEEIKNSTYANVVAEPATSVTSSGLAFTRTVAVTTNSPTTNAKTVTVTVSWTENSQAHSIPLTTIIAQ
jgi:Tfp pilus assembly protein PilV